MFGLTRKPGRNLMFKASKKRFDFPLLGAYTLTFVRLHANTIAT